MNSTQNLALEFCKQKKKEFFLDSIILADEQSDGHGRNNRKWISPFGGLWFSMILSLNIHSKNISLIPLSIGLSIFKSIKLYFNVQTLLKWPNDILYNDKKIAGIIIDAEFMEQNITNLIIGIGINVNNKSDNILSQTCNKIEVLSLSEIIGKEIDKYQFFGHIINQIISDITEIEANHQEILNEYKKNCITLGKEVKYENADKNIETSGRAIDIAKDGALIVITKKNTEKKIYIM